MEINANFRNRALVSAGVEPWIPSPMPGVSRRMLDRVGDEVARATSIVRYDAGSHFSAHTHNGGEEFLVLAGVFQDEHGDYPVGTYVRNPIDTRHTPASVEGCEIFVKLWQFDPGETAPLRVHIDDVDYQPTPDQPSVHDAILFEDARETVRVERWAPGAARTVTVVGGLEILVLEGALKVGEATLERYGWLRAPDGDALELRAGNEPLRLWTKAGHLRDIRVPTA
ncbi:MAG: cupin domain-containing protein [Pseudomonadota bacterium]